MSFEIKNVLWTPLDEISTIELRPILSTFSDRKLEKVVLTETGLANSGFASIDLTNISDLGDGRIVNIDGIQPSHLGEGMPSEEREVRWFEAAGHVIWLSRKFGTSCYSDRRVQAKARIFGPLS